MNVFIGYDSREQEAWSVCAHTLMRHATIPLQVEPLNHRRPEMTRPYRQDGVQFRDGIDGRPFSTEFSFARFLVPYLMGYQGWALFCDCDVLFRADIREVWEQRDESKAVQLVQHRYSPGFGFKMDGVVQEPYERKNWSSFVLWNCGHRAHRIAGRYRGLDLRKINAYPGFFLHTFQWLEMSEIGELGQEWNWLVGHSPTSIDPKAVHFTEGGPWFPGFQDVPYAAEWHAARNAMMRKVA